MSWGPQGPQGPQGYGQQPQGQYPQQYPQQQQQMPYGYPPQAQPPKKGLGAGCIVGIIVGVLGLVAIVGGGVLFFVLHDSGGSSSASTVSGNTDQSAALKTKAEALLAAVKTGDKTKVEDPLLEFATTPEIAKAWFDDTFEAKAADDLYGYWDRQVFPNIANLVTTFKNAITMDQTEVRVTRFANMDDVNACKLTFCTMYEGNLAKLFAAMKKPQALYLVSLIKPGSKPGEDQEAQVFYFAVVKGSFTYLDSLLL